MPGGLEVTRETIDEAAAQLGEKKAAEISATRNKELELELDEVSKMAERAVLDFASSGGGKLLEYRSKNGDGENYNQKKPSENFVTLLENIKSDFPPVISEAEKILIFISLATLFSAIATQEQFLGIELRTVKFILLPIIILVAVFVLRK